MKSLVVGIGNPNFGDDGIGYRIVKLLEGEFPVLHFLSPSLEILNYIAGYEKVVIVDGVILGGTPGTIMDFLILPCNGKERFGGGTHTLSIEEIFSVGYETFPKEMPKEVRFIGVEVKSMKPFNRGISQPVERAIPEILKRIRKFLSG